MLNNLTRHEKYILIFLLAGLIAGSSALYLKKNFQNNTTKNNLPSAEKINSAIKELKSVNINKAPARDFERLPGIGPALAGRIVAYRDSRGEFKDIKELMNVSGIGPKKFDSIKEFLILE